jgi:hypothetical protein
MEYHHIIGNHSNHVNNIIYTHEDIINFISINIYKQNKIICSSTILCYIYHALIILDYYKNTKCNNIIEVGYGYGGLCLVLNYNIIDILEICELIKNYLNVNNDYINTNMCDYSCYTYGNDITDTNLFFISNYCYTEIDKVNNDKYSSILLPRIINGFITWQNSGCGGIYPIEKI